MPPYHFSLNHSNITTSHASEPLAPHAQTQLSAAARRAIQSAVTKKTIIRRYNYQALYIDWCEDNKISRGHITDPSETTLCNYAASFIGKEAGGTVRAKLAAVKNLVIAKDNGWRGGSKLCEVLNGVEKAAPASFFHPERDPVKDKWLDLLHDEMDNSGHNAFNSCIIACADTLFYGQLRLGEVLSNSSLKSKYKSSKLPLLSDLSISNTPSNKSSAKLKLPCTKTHQSRGETVVIINHLARSNPVKALSKHIEINALTPTDPLFSYRLPDNSLQVLMKKEFLRYCNRVWSRTGIKRITGHSFRIGGTTHYLTKGIPPDNELASFLCERERKESNGHSNQPI
ncbi:hypothetical protein C8R41DRAFT_777611 [Lentinula lateritia]|uniref:DNA breaking-rejoining enzyme n=1 Tax=Lentinula lateritia TaxID=40482 RepID=A0ABQ8V7X2_9AGAR|nr:hypothetical protein C8R41DRAFT_777611 [Lentinula lateritia]